MKVFSRKKSTGDDARPGPAHAAEPDEAEIVVRGHQLAVLWWQRRIVVQYNKAWTGFIEISPDACERLDCSRKTFPDGHSEVLLLIRLLVGEVGLPCELSGSLEIAFPPDQEGALRSLVARMNDEILNRRGRPADHSAAAPPVMAVEPRPVLPERDRPRPTAKPEVGVNNVLASVAASLVRPAEEAPRPEPHRAVVVEAPEPPTRKEPPRLRQLTFLQAPNDADWVSFCPLRTADEVRAPMSFREHR